MRQKSDVECNNWHRLRFDPSNVDRKPVFQIVVQTPSDLSYNKTEVSQAVPIKGFLIKKPAQRVVLCCDVICCARLVVSKGQLHA